MRNRPWGMTLGTAMIAILLLVTLGLTLGMAVFQWRILSDRVMHEEMARDLAASVVSLAIDQLKADVRYGSTRGAGDSLSVTLAGAPEGALGRLTFHKPTAADEKLVWSTNNLEGIAVAQAEGRALPAQSAHLVGVGRCGGVERRVEAVMMLPSSPYALAANAPIRALGGMKIAGLKSLPSGPPTTEDLVGCSLLCNAGGSEAVFLSQGTDIEGDLRVVGDVKRDPNAPADSIFIRGSVQQVAPVEVPTITLTQYDPAGKMAVTTLSSSAYADHKVSSGVMRRQGNLELAGGLELTSGMLYVDGDLTIGPPGLEGEGIVVCTGKVTVQGKTSLSASQGVALLAGGDVHLTGGGPEGSFFQGMVYTAGTIKAERISVVGPTIVKGTDTMVMEQTRLLVPQQVAMKGEWSVGGGGGSYSNNLRKAFYMDASGQWHPEGAPGATGWKSSRVFEKVPGGGYRMWTFAAGGGAPTSKIVPDISSLCELMLRFHGQEVVDQAVADVSGLEQQSESGPPPAPPSSSGAATASIEVKPSEFWRKEQRLRLALWLN